MAGARDRSLVTALAVVGSALVLPARAPMAARAEEGETPMFEGSLGFPGNALHTVTTYRLEARLKPHMEGELGQ